MAYTQDEAWVSSTQDVFPAREEGRPVVSAPVASKKLNPPRKKQGKGQKSARMNGEAVDDTSAVEENTEKSLYSTFSWLKGFHNSCQNNVGVENIQKLESLVTEFISVVTPEARNCLSKPVRSTKLKRCFIDALTHFHFFYQEVKESLETTKYLDKMSGLLAMYLDMEIRASIRGKEIAKRIASRITSVLYLVLDNSQEHILDAVLQCQSILKSYKQICSPILSKILNDIQSMPRPELLYIRLLLAFKMWKNMADDVEEKKRLNKLASDRLPCPPSLVDRPKFLADVLPRIPKKKRKNITLFLMMSKFSVKDATQAFLRVTKGSQQEYCHIFTEYDSKLYFPNKYSRLLESNSDMGSESNCDALLNQMWTGLSLKSLGDASIVRPVPRSLKSIPPAVSAPASSCASAAAAPAPCITVEDTRKRKHSEDSGSENLRQKKKKRRKDNSPENNLEKNKRSEKKDGYESSHKECDDVSNKSRQEMLTLYNETSTCRLERAYNAVADFKDKLTILSRSERPSLLVEVKKEKIDSVMEEQAIYDEALPQSLLLLPPPPPPPECPAETATSQQTPSPSPPPLPVASPPRPPPPPDNVDEDSESMDCYGDDGPEEGCTSQIVDDILNPSTLHRTVSPTPMTHAPPSYTPPLQCDAGAAIPTSVPNTQEFSCKVVVSGTTTMEDEELVKSTQALPPSQPLLPKPQTSENEQTLENHCVQSEVSEQHLLLSPNSVIVSPLQPRPPTLAPSVCSTPLCTNMAPTLTETEPETHEEETSNKMDPVMPSPLADPLKDGHIVPSMMRSTDVDCTEIFYSGAPLKQEVEDKSIENKTPVHSQPTINPDIEDETKKVYFDYGVSEVPPYSFFCQRQNEYNDWFGNAEYFTVDTSEDGLSDISNKPYYEIDDGRPIPIYDGNFNKEFFIDSMDIDIDLALIEDSPKKCSPVHKPIPMVIKEECSSSRSSASTDMGLKYGSPASLYAPCSPESTVSVNNRVTPETGNKTCSESTNIPTLVQETEILATPVVTDLETEPLSERLQPIAVDTESMPILEPCVTENLTVEKGKKSESSRKSSKDRIKKSSSERNKKSEHSKKDKKSHHKKSKSDGDKKSSEEKIKKSSSKKKSSESKSKDHANKLSSPDPVTRREVPGHVDRLFANQVPTAMSTSKLTSGAPKKSTVVDVINKVGSGHISRPVAELNRRLSIPPSSASTSLVKSSTVTKPPSESAKPSREPPLRISSFNAGFKIPQISQLSMLASSRKPVEVAEEFDFLGTSDNDFSSSSDSTIPTSKGMSKLVFPEHIVCYAIKHKLLYPRGHIFFKENVKMLRNLLSRFSSSPDRKYIYFYRKNPQNSEQGKRKEGQGAIFKSKAASKSFCSSVSSTSLKPKPTSALAAPKPTSKRSSKTSNSKSVSRQSTSKADISHKSVPNRKDRVVNSSPKPSTSSLPAISSVPNVKTIMSPSSPLVSAPTKSTVSKSIPNAAPKPSTLKSRISSPKPTVDSNPKFPKVVSASKPTTVSNSKIPNVSTPVNATCQMPMADYPKPTVISNSKIPKVVATLKTIIDMTLQKPVVASPKPTTVSHSQKPKAAPSPKATTMSHSQKPKAALSPKATTVSYSQKPKAAPSPTSVPNPQISGTAPKSTPEPKPQSTKAVSSPKLTVNTIQTSASKQISIPSSQIPKTVSSPKPTANSYSKISKGVSTPKPTATPNTEIPKVVSAPKSIATQNSMIEKDVSTPTLIPEILETVSVPKRIATPTPEIPMDVSTPEPTTDPTPEMDVLCELVIDETPQMPMAASPEPTIVPPPQTPIPMSCALTVDTNPQIIISAPSPPEIVNPRNPISAPTSVVSNPHISLSVPNHQATTHQISVSHVANPQVIMSANLNSPVPIPLSSPPSVPMRAISPQPPVMPSISGRHQMVHQVSFGTTSLPHSPHIPVGQHIEPTREVSCIVNRNVPLGPPTIPIPPSETYYNVNGLALHPSIGDDDLRKKVEEAIKTLESERVPDRQKVNSLPLKKRKQAVSQSDVDLNVREPVAPSLDSYPPTLMLSIAECVAEIERKKISEAQALLNSISIQPSVVEMRSRHAMTRPPMLAASSVPPPPPPIVAPAMREATFPYPHLTPSAHTAKTIVPLTERISGTYHTNLVSIPRITFERQRSPDSQIQVALQYKKPEDIRTAYRSPYTYNEERIRRPVDLTLETAPSVSVEQKSRNARKIATKKKTEEERSKTSRRRTK